MAKNETAWELDEERVAASADGTYFVGIPGLWRPGEAVHPEAFGYTVTEFRELVTELGLPLKETKVAEGKALREFRPAGNRLESAEIIPGPGGAVEEVSLGAAEVGPDDLSIEAGLRQFDGPDADPEEETA